MAHDVPLGCAPDEYDDLISGTCSHLPYINDFGGLSFYEINCPTVNNSCNVSVAKRDK
ncbi:hypothetical protein KFU81_20370 [Escherichia coli]|nr:hypothetical protein KFU81_20370 [Escherichia coli]